MAYFVSFGPRVKSLRKPLPVAFSMPGNTGRIGNHRKNGIFDVLSVLWSKFFGNLNLTLARVEGKFQDIKMTQFLFMVNMLCSKNGVKYS